MFTQTQRRTTAGNFENEQDNTLATEGQRTEQMGFEGKVDSVESHVSEAASGNPNDATGLKSIPLSDRKELDIFDKRIPPISETNADLFNPELPDQQFIHSSTPEPFKTNLLTKVKTSGINPVIAFGAKRLAMNFVSGADPSLPSDHSVTLPLDFSSDRPDLVKIKASTAYTAADATTKTEAEAALTGTQAFRITTYTSGTQKEVLVEGLGTATMRGTAGDGNTLLDKHDIEFIDNAPRDPTDENSETPKTWTEEERQKVRAAFAILPDTVLESIAGMELQRAEKDQPDIEAYNEAVRLGQTPPSPQTAAEYSSGKHSLTVYDWGLKSSLNIYGDTKAGFTNGLQATIAHEVGHAVDRSPVRLAMNAYNSAVEISNAAIEKKNTENDSFFAHLSSLTAAFNKTNGDMITSLNALQGAVVTQYNNENNEALKVKLDDLKLLYTGGTSSKGQSILGVQNHSTATSRQQYEIMADVVREITEIADAALVTRAADLVVASYDSYVLYKSTSDFYKSVGNWDKNGGTKPVIPANIDQVSATSYIQTVESSINSKADMTQKETAYNNSTTVSGYGPAENSKGDNTVNLTKGDFRIAAAKDFKNGSNQEAINRMTAYSDTSWTEFFAESFSFYMTDPERFSALRPYLYSYFEKKYSVWKNKYPVVQ